METLNRIFRAAFVGLIAMIGLFMALVFTFSTIIAVAILYVVARFRGRKFSVQEYWTARQARHKPAFPSGMRPHRDIQSLAVTETPSSQQRPGTH
jgi:hypothetical protein